MLNLTTTDLLELRDDGPIPAWERPANPARQLRQRLKLHRRMAMDFATEANRQDRRAEDAGTDKLREYHRANAARSRQSLAEARRAHSTLAAQLGALMRPRAI